MATPTSMSIDQYMGADRPVASATVEPATMSVEQYMGDGQAQPKSLTSRVLKAIPEASVGVAEAAAHGATEFLFSGPAYHQKTKLTLKHLLRGWLAPSRTNPKLLPVSLHQSL